MHGEERVARAVGDTPIPTRRALVRAARRVLWERLRERARILPLVRSVIRRRLGGFLGSCAASRLLAILRSAALAGAVAAALLAPSSARAQVMELPAIELADIARGEGGFIVRGEGEPPSMAGGSVATAGDVNGDGIPDLIVGGSACFCDCRSTPTYVVFGTPDRGMVELSEVRAGRGGFVIRGVAEGDSSGSSVSGAGDVNGDGLADVLIGAPYAGPDGRFGSGESYVVFGKPDGVAVELAEVQVGRGGFAIRGSAASDLSGSSVSGAGDVNGDGRDDFVIGAPGASPDGKFRAGESYVVFGKADGMAVELAELEAVRSGFAIRGGASYDRAGRSVSGAGDVNGDGLADLLIGAPDASPQVRRDAGETYVVFGKAGGTAVELSEVQTGRGGFAIRGRAAGDASSRSVSGAGDVNGDGLADLVIGAPGASPAGRFRAGESYVVFGKVDGAAVELSEVETGRGGFAIRGGASYDRSGRSVSGAGDVNGDGLADFLIGAPYASPAGTNQAGESYVVFGKAGGTAVELSEVEAGRGGFAIRGGASYDRSGWRVSGAGDVNGDGLADLLIGAPRADPEGRSNAGETYVVFGKPDGEAVELSDVQAGRGGFAIRGSPANDLRALSVSGAGDVNGDGLDDLLIGAPRVSPGGRNGAGESYVVFGKAGGVPLELSEVQAGRGGFEMRGSAERDVSGSSVSGAGDVNGDGLADLLIGAPGASPAGKFRAGESYVVFGKADGMAVELSELEAGRGGFAIRGGASYDRSGRSVSGAGDVNGDGLGDLLIGAPGAAPDGRTGGGESYVVFGKTGGVPLELSEVQAGRGGFAIRGRAVFHSSGWRVSGAGDVDGDGLADLMVGVYYASLAGRYRTGANYVVFGKEDGMAVELAEVEEGRGGFAIRGSAPRDYSGSSVSGAGDVNGDGLADLVIGARYASPSGRYRAGESYIVFGKSDGAAVELSEVQAGRGGFAIRGSEPYDHSGWGVSGAGDLNGDGLADLLIGAPFADSGGNSYGGQCYVVFGKGDAMAVELSEVQTGGGGFAIRGSSESDFSGESVSGAGDVNGDGFPDLLVAAGLAGARYPSSSGAVYVVFGPGGVEPPPRFRRGAARGEESLNVSDAIHLLRYLFLGDAEPPCLDAADADDSGRLNVTDAVRVLRFLFLGADPPPDPGPKTCGEDPTDGGLGCASPTRGCQL